MNVNDEVEMMIQTMLKLRLDRVKMIDEFDLGCYLELPLNDDPDSARIRVANLDVEDSGIGPLLWKLGLLVLKQAREDSNNQKPRVVEGNVDIAAVNDNHEKAAFEKWFAGCGAEDIHRTAMARVAWESAINYVRRRAAGTGGVTTYPATDTYSSCPQTTERVYRGRDKPKEYR